MLNPKKYIRPQAPISDTGMVTMGISVAVRLRRKMKITSTTSIVASITVRNTDWIDFSMNSDES